MPRPHKPRNICKMPEYFVFGPKGIKMSKLNNVEMPIDELETIRLIDLLDYTQEEAAAQMNVARTTVQRIYNIARKKLAQSIIEGKVIVIEGGKIVLCDEDCESCLGDIRMRNRRNHRRNR